jgi:hypothetical protein
MAAYAEPTKQDPFAGLSAPIKKVTGYNTLGSKKSERLGSIDDLSADIARITKYKPADVVVDVKSIEQSRQQKVEKDPMMAVFDNINTKYGYKELDLSLASLPTSAPLGKGKDGQGIG